MKRKAILLGATSSIGKLLLSRLIDDGYVVLATFNKAENNHPSWRERFGRSVQGVFLDMSSRESVDAFLTAMESFGSPEIFINTIGATDHRLAITHDSMSLMRATMINYLAPALIASRVATLMMGNGCGYIVHITSVAARRAKIGNSAYGASKVALERFTASLALEVARFKIRTLCVAPAFVDSPMFAAYAGDKRGEIIREVPMRQILKPEEVAETVIRFIQGGLVTTGTTVNLGNGEAVF